MKWTELHGSPRQQHSALASLHWVLRHCTTTAAQPAAWWWFDVCRELAANQPHWPSARVIIYVHVWGNRSRPGSGRHHTFAY